MKSLRQGQVDVLVGVNLLREGLDLPEVSLVAILDADKEGFLRSERSLTQTAGRAARNLNSLVIMYADKITASMQKTIDETARKREIQLKYNAENNITPQAILKPIENALDGSLERSAYVEPDALTTAADPALQYLAKPKLEKAIRKIRKDMEAAVKELDFILAAQLRDQLVLHQKQLENQD
jgi:excinuclease ABC subunit B